MLTQRLDPSQPNTTLALGFAALRKLKIFQKFDRPATPELIDNFPLTISPVTDDVAGLLISLGELSDQIPLDKTYVLYPMLSEIMSNGLLLVRELTNLNVQNRKEKIAALTAAIKRTTVVAQNPRHGKNPGEANILAANMNSIIDTAGYFFRAEHRTATGVIGTVGTAAAGAMVVVGGLLIPFNIVLAIGCMLTGSIASSGTLLLAIQYIRPINADEFLTSQRVHQLVTEIKKFTDASTLMGVNYTNHPVAAPLLSTAEEEALTEQQLELGKEYDNYLALVKNFKDDKNPDSALLQSLLSTASYEAIKTSGNFLEFCKLLEELKRLKNYAHFQGPESIVYHALQSTLLDSLELGLEIGSAKQDMQFSATRKAKLAASTHTVQSMITFVNDFGNQENYEKLVKASLVMRRKIEGPYITRKENRLLSGILSAITLAVSVAAQVSLFVLVCALPPVGVSVAIIAAVVMAHVGLATSMALGIAGLVNSFLPESPKQQDNANDIYQQVINLKDQPAQTVFHSARIHQPKNSLRKVNMSLSSQRLATHTEETAEKEEKNETIIQCSAGYKALRQLKLIQIPGAQDAYAKLINEFPMDISPVTSDLASLLQELGNLSKTIIKSKASAGNKDVEATLTSITYKTLTLANELAGMDVNNRQEKLVALKKCITEVNALTQTPVDVAINFDALTAACTVMNKTVKAPDLLAELLSLQVVYPHHNVASRRLGLSTQQLSRAEKTMLDDAENKVVRGYSNYLDDLDNLIENNENTAEVILLNSLKSPACYEVINANYSTEFTLLLKNINSLKTYLTTKQDSFYLLPLNEMLNDAIALTYELGQEKQDARFYATRKTKIIALSETIAATVLFANCPNQTAKDDLITATLNLRNTIEGSYMFRKENRLIAGIIGAVITVLTIAALAASALLLIQFAPVLAPITLIGLAVTSGIGSSFFATLGGGLLSNSISPANPLEQDKSKNIYQQAGKLTPNIFNKKPEPVKEIKETKNEITGSKPRVHPVF